MYLNFVFRLGINTGMSLHSYYPKPKHLTIEQSQLGGWENNY